MLMLQLISKDSFSLSELNAFLSNKMVVLYLLSLRKAQYVLGRILSLIWYKAPKSGLKNRTHPCIYLCEYINKAHLAFKDLGSMIPP